MDTDKLARLPKWARDKITNLERELGRAIQDRDEARGQAQRVFVPEGKSNVEINDYLHDQNVALPDRSTIRFKLPAVDAPKWTEGKHHIDVSIRRGKLYVNGITGYLNVWPGAANVVEIGVEH